MLSLPCSSLQLLFLQGEILLNSFPLQPGRFLSSGVPSALPQPHAVFFLICPVLPFPKPLHRLLFTPYRSAETRREKANSSDHLQHQVACPVTNKQTKTKK